MDIFAIKAGELRRLMANVILNFHFFGTPPLVWQVQSTQCLSTKKNTMRVKRFFPGLSQNWSNVKLRLVVLITTNPRVIISLMYDSGSSTWLHCPSSRCTSPSSQLLHIGKVLTITFIIIIIIINVSNVTIIFLYVSNSMFTYVQLSGLFRKTFLITWHILVGFKYEICKMFLLFYLPQNCSKACAGSH